LKVAVAGNRLFMAGGQAGLRILDEPTSAGLVELGGLNPTSLASDIAIAGQHAYLADGPLGLRVYDLGDPDRPREIAHYQTIGTAIGVCLNGSRAYVSAEMAGLEVLDIQDPAQPRHLATLDTSGSVQGVSILGDYALVADGTGGLLVVRISDPAHPVIYSQSKTPGYASSVVGVVNRAYVCDMSGTLGLWAINVGNPAFPAAEGQLASLSAAAQVAYDGRHLGLAETDGGFRTIQAGPPGLFRTIGKLEIIGWFQGLAMEGNLAYVADANFGLRVLNVLDPYSPSQAGFVPTPGFPRRVAVAHGRIYMAAGEAGLYVLQFHWASDLTIQELDFDPQEVVVGSELHLAGKVSNSSTTPTATGAWVKVYASPTRDFAEPRWLLCPPLRLEAGMTQVRPIDLAQRRFVVLGGIPKGIYTVGIIVDSDNEVAEFREENNILWLPDKPLYIGPPPAGVKSWKQYK
jgi:hypothetical protein